MATFTAAGAKPLRDKRAEQGVAGGRAGPVPWRTRNLHQQPQASARTRRRLSSVHASQQARRRHSVPPEAPARRGAVLRAERNLGEGHNAEEKRQRSPLRQRKPAPPAVGEAGAGFISIVVRQKSWGAHVVDPVAAARPNGAAVRRGRSAVWCGGRNTQFRAGRLRSRLRGCRRPRGLLHEARCRLGGSAAPSLSRARGGDKR